MRILKFALLLVLALAFQACGDEGFVKVFKCPDSKPFFNTVNNKCYTSEEAAEEVNKHLMTDDNSNSEDASDNSDENANGDASDNSDENANGDASDNSDENANGDASDNGDNPENDNGDDNANA